jgi:excisionase family DNA binding protein
MSIPSSTELSPLLTAAQVCKQFGSIRRRYLYSLARRGLIPSVRLGGRLRFPLSGLQSWLAAGGKDDGEPQP